MLKVLPTQGAPDSTIFGKQPPPGLTQASIKRGPQAHEITGPMHHSRLALYVHHLLLCFVPFVPRGGQATSYKLAGHLTLPECEFQLLYPVDSSFPCSLPACCTILITCPTLPRATFERGVTERLQGIEMVMMGHLVRSRALSDHWLVGVPRLEYPNMSSYPGPLHLPP